MKSKNFSSWTYVGDPMNTSKIFNDKETDELVILDVDATLKKREPNYSLLEKLAAECFLPISYGGGVSSAEIAKKVVDCGIDKVAINSAIFGSSQILSEVSQVVGASSTIASVDVINRKGKYEIYGYPSLDLTDYISGLESLGAGEVLVQSVSKDGTRSGPDLSLAAAILSATSLPTIYGGGVSSLDHAIELWKLGVDGVAAGSWFVFSGRQAAVLVTYPSRKNLDQAMRVI